MKNEKPSIGKLSKVSKPPDNKPATRKWARIAFTWLMWILPALGTMERLIKKIGRVVAWLREMSDDS